MSRYVYVTENSGDEPGLDMVFSSPGKAIKRLREHWGVSLPRGSVSRLQNGEVVWVDQYDSYIACARRQEVH